MTFNPEYLTDYEVGAKTEWDLSADLNLRLNLAIFRGNFTDQQIAQAVFVNNAFATVTTNAGASRTEGAEVEWNVQSKTGLGFSGYYDFLNARYLDYFDGTNRLNGHRLDNTPRNKASGTLSYEHSLAEDAGDLRFAVSYRWQDNVTAFRSTVIGDPLNNQKAYGVTDLRFDWYKFMGHNLDVGAFATNITDEVYKIYHISTYNSIGSATSIYSEPRMYGVDLKVSF